MNTAGAILLFFSGVIVFVPERQGSKLVNALLINLDQHAQVLKVPSSSFRPGQVCPASYCYTAGNFCECRLNDINNPQNDVTVSIVDKDPIGTVQDLPTTPPGILPRTSQDAAKIDWLVNMAYVKPNAARVVQARIPEHVGGRVSFNWQEAATCRFEEAICNNKSTRRIFAVRFVVAVGNNRRQAVPESVVFKSMISSAQGSIQLKKVGSAPAFLELNCPAAGCPVSIINSMRGDDDTAVLCTTCYEDRERTHFREYRRLSNDISGAAPYRLCGGGSDDYVDLPNTRPLLCTQSLDRLNLKREEIDAISNRVICPPAIMIP
jgi:hypothetical protein